MIARIIDFVAKNRFLVVLVTILVTAWAIYATYNLAVDAIPDLSDVQVIILTDYPGQAPQVVEDQVTYPLTTAMLAVPKAKVVRGYSMFGESLVYVIFEDGTDIYWARTRVLEYLNFVRGKLPKDVNPALGPDATGVGWVFEYMVEDPTGKHDLAQLRSIQDWYLRYQLQTVPGVAEVASVGGFVKQYQVVVDPNTLASYGIPLSKVKDAIMRSNNDVGGRVIEQAETEYMVRGLGYIKSIQDVQNIVVGADRKGTPVMIKDIGIVRLGPELRRGLAEANGQGEVVGGIVIARYGENARAVIDGVKAKLEELKSGLPPGVIITPAYDRSNLINRAVENLTHKLIEEMIVVALVCVIFLLHFRSSLVAIVTLPLGVLISLGIMYEAGISANIMSLGGIALAIGVMVDAAVIMIENAHKHIEHAPPDAPRGPLILEAAKEVGPSLFFSLLVITVSFLPIFALGAESGRLFKPLAYTKTFAMAAASLLAITLVPIMMLAFLRGKIPAESRNPINRVAQAVYHPLLEGVLRFPKLAICVAVILVAVTVYPLLPAGLRIHAAHQRRRPVVHAHHHAGHLHHRSEKHPPADGPHHPHLPGGGKCLRQGRPGRNRHRPGAPEHARDHHPPQGPQGLAAGPDHGRPHPADGRGGEISGALQLLGLSHQDPHRHAVHGHQDPHRPENHRSRPRGAEPPGDPGRSPLQEHPRDRQRLRGTHHRGLLPGFRH